MARPLRIEYPGAFYHITSRGNEKGRIYAEDGDRERFLTYLGFAHKKFKIVIHSYCLMPNHYHLLLETPISNLSRSMQFINSSYTTYYNIKRKRAGHLFQGRYKAILVDKDSYIQVLTRYIHLNPVRAKMVKLPEEYPWSSYKYYIFPKRTPEFLNVNFALSYFNKSRKEYKRFTEEGIAGKISDPFKELKAGLILGGQEFVENIKHKYLKNVRKSVDLPSLRELKEDRISPDTIVGILKKENTLKERERTKLAIYFMRKYTGDTLQEISERISDKKLTTFAISKITSRLETKRKQDKRLDEKLKEIESKMSNVKA